jgi:hypothetical protein
MATEKRQKVPGSGRKSGTKNILPPLGKSARETLMNILAFDDEAVTIHAAIQLAAAAVRLDEGVEGGEQLGQGRYSIT